MKVCSNCGSEDVGRDGEDLCRVCDGAEKKTLANQRRRENAKERNQVLRDLGLVRVRGALGGVYWE